MGFLFKCSNREANVPAAAFNPEVQPRVRGISYLFKPRRHQLGAKTGRVLRGRRAGFMSISFTLQVEMLSCSSVHTRCIKMDIDLLA